MVEIKISKKSSEYLEQEKCKTLVITLEADCTCIGSKITALKLELLKEKQVTKPGYTSLPTDSINLLVDENLCYRSNIAIYLNEGKIGNVFDIEGIEVQGHDEERD